MNITPIDEEVIKYFAAHNFDHSWDFSFKNSEEWNEFYFDGKLICQIDAGVPLNCLLEDLKCLKEGKEPTSNCEFKINLPKENEKLLFDLLNI